MTIAQALEDIYTALHANNDGLDARIAALKAALETEGAREVVVDASRLPNNSRPGRRMMQTYFKKRGVVVVFKTVDAA